MRFPKAKLAIPYTPKFFANSALNKTFSPPVCVAHVCVLPAELVSERWLKWVYIGPTSKVRLTLANTDPIAHTERKKRIQSYFFIEEYSSS